MSDTGWKNPSSAAESGESYVWANPTNIYTSNDTYSIVTITGEADTDDLIAWNFGNSIPSGSTINGVEVKVELKSGGCDVNDVEAILFYNDDPTIEGDDKATQTAISTSEGTVTYGSSSDKWGLELTPAIVNLVIFGFSFVAGNATEGTSVSVDNIQIKVYYTDSETPTVGTKYALPAFSNVSGSGGGSAPIEP